MYIPEHISSGYGLRVIVHPHDPQLLLYIVLQWLTRVWHVFWDHATRFAPRIVSFLFRAVEYAFTLPPEWGVEAFRFIHDLLNAYPHPTHILAWSIFFGPIIILLPFLLVHELIILILFNLSAGLHGLIPGSPTHHYDSLHHYFSDQREAAFARVDRAGAAYNKRTTEFIPLMVLRLVAGALGGYVLWVLWSGVIVVEA